MPDLVEPASTTLTNAEVLAIAGLEKTALLANAQVQLGLYKSNVIVTRDTKLNVLTEATFGGYSRITLSAWNGPYADQFGSGYILSNLQIFTCDGTAGNQIYGYFATKANAGVRATATNVGNAGAYDVNFVVTNGGTLYEVPPTVHLTGATGSGATAHAVLTNGVVTDIVLDTPGSGYTTYTVVIDYPSSLISVSPLAQPLSMNLATDAMACVQEIEIPTITNS